MQTNLSKISRGFVGFEPPHGLEQRWRYDVPAGRACCLESVFIEMQRELAASAPGGVSVILIQYTPAGQAPIHIIAFNGFGCTETDLGKMTPIKEAFPHMTLLAGDEVECLTIDTSVGGQHAFVAYMSGTEYDA